MDKGKNLPHKDRICIHLHLHRKWPASKDAAVHRLCFSAFILLPGLHHVGRLHNITRQGPSWANWGCDRRFFVKGLRGRIDKVVFLSSRYYHFMNVFVALSKILQ